MASRADRPRVVFGVPLTPQLVALVLAALVLMILMGLAVLSWLEQSA